MNHRIRSMRIIAKVLLVCFITVSFQQAALASMVTTTDLVDEQLVLSEKQRLVQLFSSEQVTTQLIEMGVDPVDAKQRLENMTDEEIMAFSARMDEMPAGSGVVGALVFVFLVLLVTDLLGYTDVFPFVKKTVK
ncbi:PA2779 family protein [Kaarinaea lacus]